MALFQKRPDYGSKIGFVTYGMRQSILVVGLGNPGDEYTDTRHNVGFACLDEFARKNDFPDWVKKGDLKCLITHTRIGDTTVYLIKPQTFMNLSGESVQAVQHFYKINLDQLYVIHDELDVNFGQIRLKKGGSSAGHNGIKSISKHIGENYGRIRVGIGPKSPEQIDSADFVLGKFTSEEKNVLPKLTREVSAVLSELAYGSQFSQETRNFL